MTEINDLENKTVEPATSPVEEAKVEEVAPVETKAEEPVVIAVPETETTGPGVATIESGAIASTNVKAPKPKAEKPVAAVKEETVAIHSTRNVNWQGVGSVKLGVNIVSKEAAEQWLKRDHIKLVTPEEVAKEFNK